MGDELLNTGICTINKHDTFKVGSYINFGGKWEI